jgi:S-DNA-T family DNA segregation ATPase FtsK/SpoIIIE
MLLSLSDHLSPEDLQYYILTYSGKTLQALKNLPHCGAVLGEENMDSLERFFRMIDEIIEERKGIYREYEVSSFESCRQAIRLPMILVVIDNVRQLKDTKEAMKYYDALPDYLKNGLIYGVQFVITSSALGDLMSRAKGEIGDRIALRVKDRFDISDLLGTKVNDVPPENPGRGTILYEDRPLECQAAVYRADLQGKERMDALRSIVKEISQKYCGMKAARTLGEIRKDEDYLDFLHRFQSKRLPIGYSLLTARPVVLPEKQFSMLSVYFGNPDRIEPITENLMQWAAAEEMEVMILLKKDNSLFAKKRNRRKLFWQIIQSPGSP